MRRALLTCAAICAVAALAVVVAGGRGANGAASGASAETPPLAGDLFEPQLGLPTTKTVAFGSSVGEMWAYGVLGQTPVNVNGKAYSNQYTLLERAKQSNESASGESPPWQTVPLPEGAEGRPLASASERGPSAYGALAGQATEDGGVVLLSGAHIVIGNPGGQPELAPEPPVVTSGSEEGLEPGESLLPPNASSASTVPYAAIEEEGASKVSGLLIAPHQDGGKQSATGEPEYQPGVLHYDGHQWTRERIEAESDELNRFTALAISCSGTESDPDGSSTSNCWLLASDGESESKHLVLYRRVRSSASSAWTWKLQAVKSWLLGTGALPEEVHKATVAPLAQGAQMLTATAQGVWVDFQARINNSTTPADVTALVLAPESAGDESNLAGQWCYPTTAGCERSLGAPLPLSYRSFAWPGSAATDPGTRVITGLPNRTTLELANGAFEENVGPGGEPESAGGGAALYRSTPQGAVEGAIADGVRTEVESPDREGQSQVINVAPPPATAGGESHEEADQLHEEAVPFRYPLLAVAEAPGFSAGNSAGEALAVGLHGEVGRYIPGVGWQPEGLYNAEGKTLDVTLRGVAWPEPHRAYAVGDEGSMWMWMKETGYWVPDPAKPFNFDGNLTAIAFDANDPLLGFAVGKEGGLLKYGKSWEEITKQKVKKEAGRLEHELQVEEWLLNFTSVAFAGSEALATYRIVAEGGKGNEEAGGLLVYNEAQVCVSEDALVEREIHKALPPGERPCWHVDLGAATLLAEMPVAHSTVLSKVTGLPDGGAVAAGPDLVMERESATAPWRLSQAPLPEAQNISALAAYREAGTGVVRAIASIDVDRMLNPNALGVLRYGPYGGDVPVVAGTGQPPPYIPPDPLPNSGYVLKETASGWIDMEHDEALPTKAEQRDLPIRPTPVFALLVNASGEQGLAVGGQTYDVSGTGSEEKGETAGALRFPVAGGQGESTTATLGGASGDATFVVGGEASCAEPCAALANEGIGADVWLTHALQTASRIEGARAFIYVGGRTGQSSGSEKERFQDLLGGASGLPVAVEPLTFGGEPIAPAGFTRCAEASTHRCAAGTTAYSFKSSGEAPSEASVKVIMLDFANGTLEVAGSEPRAQEEWLEAELAASTREEEPAIVVGRDALGFNLPEEPDAVATQARDAEAVSRILVAGHALAYVFDYAAVNLQTRVSYKGVAIPAFATGTIGPQSADTGEPSDSLQSSAFLELNVNMARRTVEASAVPNVGELAIDATNGTLLRRSRVALFEGLGRRSPAGIQIGGSAGNGSRIVYPSSYDPIPTDCQGPNCAYEVPLEFTFSSSNPEVGGFVVHEASSANTSQVQLNSKGEPIPDEPRDASGELIPGGRFDRNSKGELINERGEPVPAARSTLFCAYNEGTTTISISAGGLTYSMPITVQGGSAERPCGTVPLKHLPPLIEPANTPFVVPGTTSPGFSGVNPQISTLPPPPPPVLPHHHAPPRHIAAPLSVPAALFAVPPLPLQPAPNVPRPTPPSGTAQVPSQSPVSQTVGATEREEEVEGAYQHVHNMAAYKHEDPTPTWPIALVVIAAAAAAGLRPRRDRDSPVYAWVRSWRRDL